MQALHLSWRWYRENSRETPCIACTEFLHYFSAADSDWVTPGGRQTFNDPNNLCLRSDVEPDSRLRNDSVLNLAISDNYQCAAALKTGKVQFTFCPGHVCAHILIILLPCTRVHTSTLDGRESRNREYRCVQMIAIDSARLMRTCSGGLPRTLETPVMNE